MKTYKELLNEIYKPYPSTAEYKVVHKGKTILTTTDGLEAHDKAIEHSKTTNSNDITHVRNNRNQNKTLYSGGKILNTEKRVFPPKNKRL